MEGVLEEFVQKLNLHLVPLKDHSQNLDRLSLLFLIIGFLATVTLAIVFG
jgi:hypothetical protein